MADTNMVKIRYLYEAPFGKVFRTWDQYTNEDDEIKDFKVELPLGKSMEIPEEIWKKLEKEFKDYLVKG